MVNNLRMNIWFITPNICKRDYDCCNMNKGKTYIPLSETHPLNGPR